MGLCLNEKPIFELTIYNDSNSLDLGNGFVVDQSVSAVYYLHYQLITTSVGADATGMWMVSKDEISVNFVAVCVREDILDCSASAWEVMTTQGGDEETDADNVVQTGLLVQRVDEAMSVQRGSCEEISASESGGDDDSMVVVVVIVVFVVLCCRMGTAGLAFWCCSRANRGKATIDGADPQTATATAEAQAEPEIEVSMERAAVITATND